MTGLPVREVGDPDLRVVRDEQRASQTFLGMMDGLLAVLHNVIAGQAVDSTSLVPALSDWLIRAASHVQEFRSLCIAIRSICELLAKCKGNQVENKIIIIDSLDFTLLRLD